MNKRKILAIFIITILMLITSGCVVNVTVPEVKEGRFDFSVTYEVDGEEHTYYGVYICKYEGINVSLYGTSRMWDGYIEDAEYGTTVIVKTIEDVVIYINLRLNPEYFMADPDYFEETPIPTLFIECIDTETGEVFFLGDESEIFENYGIKLIGYNYPDPIENSYKSELTYGNFEPGIN